MISWKIFLEYQKHDNENRAFQLGINMDPNEKLSETLYWVNVKIAFLRQETNYAFHQFPILFLKSAMKFFLHMEY